MHKVSLTEHPELGDTFINKEMSPFEQWDRIETMLARQGLIVVKGDANPIDTIDKFIERDKKLAEIFDTDDWHYHKKFNKPYSSRITRALEKLRFFFCLQEGL